MTRLVALIRLAAAVLGAIAIVVTLEASIGAGEFDASRFFGYFTIQGNGVFAIVMLIAAVAGFTGHRQGGRLVFARACMTTYMVVVGVVYNTLLATADVGVLVPWANYTLHLWLPIYAAVDWLLFADRPALRWKLLPLSLVYPLLWTAATIVRQFVEANPFVPYPFLNIARLGGGTVTLYVIGIAIGFIGFGALVWWASRIRSLKV